MSNQGRALISALKRGDYSAVDKAASLTPGELNTVNHYAHELFERAIEKNDLKFFQALISIPGIKMSGPEYCAIAHATRKGLLRFLQSLENKPGLEPNFPDEEGNAPLMIAASGPRDALKARDLAASLVKIPGIKINQKGPQGRTALHQAVLKQRYELASLLMDEGAHPKLTDNSGQSPLSIGQKAQDIPVPLFMKMLTHQGPEPAPEDLLAPGVTPPPQESDEVSGPQFPDPDAIHPGLRKAGPRDPNQVSQQTGLHIPPARQAGPRDPNQQEAPRPQIQVPGVRQAAPRDQWEQTPAPANQPQGNQPQDHHQQGNQAQGNQPQDHQRQGNQPQAPSASGSQQGQAPSDQQPPARPQNTGSMQTSPSGQQNPSTARQQTQQNTPHPHTPDQPIQAAPRNQSQPQTPPTPPPGAPQQIRQAAPRDQWAQQPPAPPQGAPPQIRQAGPRNQDPQTPKIKPQISFQQKAPHSDQQNNPKPNTPPTHPQAQAQGGKQAPGQTYDPPRKFPGSHAGPGNPKDTQQLPGVPGQSGQSRPQSPHTSHTPTQQTPTHSTSTPTGPTSPPDQAAYKDLPAEYGFENTEDLEKNLDRTALLENHQPTAPMLLHRKGIQENLDKILQLLTEREEPLRSEDLGTQNQYTLENFWHAAARNEIFTEALNQLAEEDLWPLASQLFTRNLEGHTPVSILEEASLLNDALQSRAWYRQPEILAAVLAQLPPDLKRRYNHLITRTNLLILHNREQHETGEK